MARTNNSMVKVPTMPLQPPSSTYPKNFSRTTRNFHDKRVGGMIFTCRHDTRDECLENKLFGMPFSHYSRVKSIKPGLPLFLLNLSDRKLHGIFEPASYGKMNIDRKAWTRNFSPSTLRPAQVRIRIKRKCLPLEEKVYTRVIEKYDPTKPLSWFELDPVQTKALLELFEPLAVRNQQRMVWLAKSFQDNLLADPHHIERPTVIRDSEKTKKVESLTPHYSSSRNSDPDPKGEVTRVPGSDQTVGNYSPMKVKSKKPTADAKWTKVVSRKQNRKCKPSVGLGNANKYVSDALGSTLKEEEMVTKRNLDYSEIIENAHGKEKEEEMVTKRNLNYSEILEIAYGNGGVDVSIPEIDIIIDIRYKRFCTYGVEEKVEEKIDEKEKHRIDKILEKIDKESHGIDIRFIFPYDLPDVKYFLVEPKEDIECTFQEMTVRSLDIYYKRLFPNVESAHERDIPARWNRLPEVDSQYLRLFSKLWGLFDQKSFITYLESTTPTNRKENLAKAKEIVEDVQLGKLRDNDISECLEDVFRERDIVTLHKLKTECDMYLLECMHCQDSPPKEFAPKTPIPVCQKVTYFCHRSQKMRFNRLMDEVKGLDMQLEAGLKVIKEHHKKSLEEDCSIRFRYVKFKRTLAKDLGIISEETFRQELGDYLNEASEII